MRVLLVLIAVAACVKEPEPPRYKYDGTIATALSMLARDCVPIGTSVGKPLAKASDMRCTAPDAEVMIHLDQVRSVRTLQIRLLAASTEEARVRLTGALAPIMDDHHRKHIFSHLDDRVPDDLMNPIEQLELEWFLYQVAREKAGDKWRYILKIRID